MTTLTEGIHTGEFLLSEAKGKRSRDAVTVTIAGAVALPSGTVMGKVTTTGKFVKYDEAGTDDGRRVAAGVLYTDLPGVNGDVKAVVITRDAEVIASKLTGLDTAGRADLAALGIICR